MSLSPSRSDEAVIPVPASRGDRHCAQPARHPASRRAAQAVLVLGSNGLGFAAAPKLATRGKRNSMAKARAEFAARKKLRHAGYSADTRSTGKRARHMLTPKDTPNSTGGTKRKGTGSAVVAPARHGGKRKHAAGIERLQSTHTAHCDSSNSDCAVHSAGGSLRVGAENPVANLGKSTMRPLD